MTVSYIITILSACDFIDDLKIIDINIEPPVQSIKLHVQRPSAVKLCIDYLYAKFKIVQSDVFSYYN
jgi:hypothetical protein